MLCRFRWIGTLDSHYLFCFTFLSVSDLYSIGTVPGKLSRLPSLPVLISVSPWVLFSPARRGCMGRGSSLIRMRMGRIRTRSRLDFVLFCLTGSDSGSGLRMSYSIYASSSSLVHVPSCIISYVVPFYVLYYMTGNW